MESIVGTTSYNKLPQMDVIVPTGAMGNLVAGYMAQQLLGLPVRKFIAAVNVNDATHRVVTTGVLQRPHGEDNAHPMQKTLSDAINVQVPYNLERWLYYLTDGDSERVRAWYDDLAQTGRMDLKQPLPNQQQPNQPDDDDVLARLQSVLGTARVTDAQLCAALRQVYHAQRYLVDPHTAVALSAAMQLGYLRLLGDGMRGGVVMVKRRRRRRQVNTTEHDNNDRPAATALLATASPCKFQEAVTQAVGEAVWREYVESKDFPATAKALLEKEERPPLRYPAVMDDTGAAVDLPATQRHWETLLRQVVAELEEEKEVEDQKQP